VPLADVAREVAFDDADFVDPMHYSAAGSDRLAAFFAPRVAALVREIAAGAGGAPGGGDRRLPGPPPGPPR
jgi:hypothetical protein